MFYLRFKEVNKVPFVMLYGLPKDTHPDHMVVLRRDIVELLHKEMQIPISWVRPFAVPDLFSSPVSVEDGAKTIYVRIDTAMFFEKPETFSKELVLSLATLIWKFYEGAHEVECFIGNMNPEWKCLLPPQTPAISDFLA